MLMVTGRLYDEATMPWSDLEQLQDAVVGQVRPLRPGPGAPGCVRSRNRSSRRRGRTGRGSTLDRTVLCDELQQRVGGLEVGSTWTDGADSSAERAPRVTGRCAAAAVWSTRPCSNELPTVASALKNGRAPWRRSSAAGRAGRAATPPRSRSRSMCSSRADPRRAARRHRPPLMSDDSTRCSSKSDSIDLAASR